jgi:hypothetical protein
VLRSNPVAWIGQKPGRPRWWRDGRERAGTAKINNERDFRRSSRFAIEAALFHEQT